MQVSGFFFFFIEREREREGYCKDMKMVMMNYNLFLLFVGFSHFALLLRALTKPKQCQNNKSYQLILLFLLRSYYQNDDDNNNNKKKKTVLFCFKNLLGWFFFFFKLNRNFVSSY